MQVKTRTSVIKLGRHRGNPRIYLEGRWLVDAGFEPGTSYDVVYANSCVRITTADSGRTVSSKKDGAHGVIDLNCSELAKVFNNISKLTVRADAGCITITPARTVVQRARRVLTAAAVALFAGGGLLSQASEAAGFEIVAAVEINSKYAAIYQANHSGRMYNCSVEEVAWDELERLAPVGLLEMGIPCEPFSAIRRLDRGGQTKRSRHMPPEAHELGDMVYWALKAADVVNPHTVIVEQVPRFLESGAGFILQLALQRMGYTVDARIINPLEFGAITGRKRAVIVATTFDEVRWPKAVARPRQLGEVLDDVPDDDELWFNRKTKPWLYHHWERQTARGNGFEPPKLTAANTSCPTIKKRYFAGQGDNPVVQHPLKPDHHRWLTLTEVRRLMGLPNGYDLGNAKTIAGEVLGQGVQVDTFTQIIRSVTNSEVAEPVQKEVLA